MSDQGAGPQGAASPEVALEVRTIVARALEMDVADVDVTSSLFALGAESLDLVDMAFMLETRYQIQFPRTDILERAAQHFPEGDLVDDGVLTDLGLHLLREGMPELAQDLIRPGLRDVDVAQMITVGSFARITQRLLDAKAQFPRDCPKCASRLVESPVMPEFECPACGQIVGLPSGDEVLLQDLVELYQHTRERG